MMPQDLHPDVKRDRDLRPILGEDELPILSSEDAYTVFNALGRAVRDRVRGFDALTTPTALLVSVVGENSTYLLEINEHNRGGLHSYEDVIAVLGVYGQCNAARSRHQQAA